MMKHGNVLKEKKNLTDDMWSTLQNIYTSLYVTHDITPDEAVTHQNTS